MVAVLGSLALAAPAAALDPGQCPTLDAHLITQAVKQRVRAYGYTDVRGHCARDGDPFVTLSPIECDLTALWNHSRPEPRLRQAAWSIDGRLVQSGYSSHYRVRYMGEARPRRHLVGFTFASFEPACPPDWKHRSYTKAQLIAIIIRSLRP